MKTLYQYLKKHGTGLHAALLAAVLAAGSFAAGCGAKTEEPVSAGTAAESTAGAASASAGVSADSAETPVEPSETPILDIPVIEGEFTTAECIVLGDYRHLVLTRPDTTVTDEEVEAELRKIADYEIVSGPDDTVQDGDLTTIAYEGTLDGEPFEGGSSDSCQLTIGSGTFIDGFEDGMIGMKTGETRDLQLVFPEQYPNNPNLAGKDVVFSVTLLELRRKHPVTNADVMDHTGGAATTVAEYRAFLREQLEAEKNADADAELQAQAWDQTENSSTFLALPAVYIQAGEAVFDNMLQQEADSYGMSVEAYLQLSGASQEQYEAQKALYGRYAAESRVLLDALTEAEGITEDSEEYQAQVSLLEESQGMKLADLITSYGEDTVTEYLLTQTVAQRLVSMAEVNQE